MIDRIDNEIALVLTRFKKAEASENKRWIKIPEYELPANMGWNETCMDICCEFKSGYPGVAPYGIYVPSYLLYNGQPPGSWKAVVANRPPFDGEWGMLSWSPPTWNPQNDLVKGSNMLNFIQTFQNRFLSGQ